MAQKTKKARTGKKAVARKKSKRQVSSKGDTTKKTVTKTKRASAKRGRAMAAPKARSVPVKFVAGGPDDNLAKIDHIVVLMMENRSFDHMFGYLKLEGANPDVDGLDVGMSNTLVSEGHPQNGESFTVHRLSETLFEHDPGHQELEVAQQLSNHNGGFVTDYVGKHAEDDPALIMGYHNGSSIPVYDHLARNFCICDRWFCSVPGATWPNRLYAATGQSPTKSNPELPKFPYYNIPSFVRHLEAAKVSWGWYAHDVGTLRIIDRRYRVGYGSNFFWFDRRTWVNPENFLDHAASGNLPAVSWIDPNFVDWPVTGPKESNDDHPPSDIMAGQDLVLKLYNAVVNSPNWKKTLLVITYDEHGGFYDHVEPDDANDDNPKFRKYGVRVPAIVISPWLERGKVTHEVFDHTSIIKTILLRFCRRADGTIPDMGARVNNARQLGTLLTLDTPRDPTPVEAYQHLIERIAQWRTDGFKSRMLRQARGQSPAVPETTKFQEGIEKARQRLREEGLPEGQP